MSDVHPAMEVRMSVGKVIAITGASSGIGEAIAELVATRGARVLIGARRTDRLEALSDKLTAAGGQADYRELDVTRRQSVTDFVRAAVDRFGRLDVIVNNAGVMPLSPLAELKVDDWDRMIDTNVKGVLYGIAAALPIFRAQGNGHVVNISSIGALGVVPTAAVYCATKAAVRFISEGLRQESSNIRVTCVNPGVVESELASTITHDETIAMMKRYRAIALHPAEIAKAIWNAIEAPQDVNTTEITIRPTASSH
jgi:NADP-dependent 3-hydroxy acid dehydrogenase YdfG